MARRLYARVLTEMLAQREGAPREDRAHWDLLFDRLLHDGVWAATELHRGTETKLFRQRYISADTRKLWRSVRDVPPSTRGKCSAGLQHEHVVESKKLKERVRNAKTADACYEVLSSAVACVVTADEHDRLNTRGKGFDGWGRYRAAEVAVWDRVEGQWVEEAGLYPDSDQR